jgi:hypothetical protein
MTPTVGEARTLSAVLGGSKELAVFEAFALRNEQALSVKDASLLAKVAWATAHRLVSDWAIRGVLDEAGKVGKARQYHLNLDSPTVRTLSRVVNMAVRELLQADAVAEGMPESALSPWLESAQHVPDSGTIQISFSNTLGNSLVARNQVATTYSPAAPMTEVPV